MESKESSPIGAPEYYSEDDNFNEIAKSLRKANPETVRITDGAVINDVSIKNYEGKYGNYRYVVLTLSKKVKSFASTPDATDEFGNPVYAEGVSNQIFILENQILACMGQNNDVLVKSKAKDLRKSKDEDVINTLLGCVVNVCQIRVNENDVFLNPFSRNAKPYRVQHNSWYSYVCLILPSKDLELELALNHFTQEGGQLSFSDFMSFGRPYHINRLNVVLAEKKRSNEWLAEQLGVDPVIVSNWCTNSVQPPLMALLKTKKLLEVDIKDLIRFDELDNDEN